MLDIIILYSQHVHKSMMFLDTVITVNNNIKIINWDNDKERIFLKDYPKIQPNSFPAIYIKVPSYIRPIIVMDVTAPRKDYPYWETPYEEEIVTGKIELVEETWEQLPDSYTFNDIIIINKFYKDRANLK